MAPEPRPHHTVAATDALSADPVDWALFLDLDGTLIDIADTPETVVVPEALPALLERLARGLDGALAIISGRPLEQIDRLLHPHRFVIAGLHGLEWRLSPDARPVVDHCLSIEELRPAIRTIGESFGGVLMEDKGNALAIHYRRNPAAAAQLRVALEKAIAGHNDIELLSGKMVFEIKPAAANKRVAVHRLMQRTPFAGRVPIFVGDDTTDRDGFKAARELGGMAVAVGAAVSDEQALILPNPSAVRQWLLRIAERLECRQ